MYERNRLLERLAEAGLAKGKRIGIDATTLEANAALRSIVRRDNGDSYEESLKGLARRSGIETPTRGCLLTPPSSAKSQSELDSSRR